MHHQPKGGMMRLQIFGVYEAATRNGPMRLVCHRCSGKGDSILEGKNPISKLAIEKGATRPDYHCAICRVALGSSIHFEPPGEPVQVTEEFEVNGKTVKIEVLKS